jgi:hypothetical protein
MASLMAKVKANPTVICLCGSTKFKDEFERINRDLTLAGNIVLSVGFFGHADAYPLSPETKMMIDELHLRKIDKSDEIFVINVGGYIGDSTRAEIEYAKEKGKKVEYLETPKLDILAKLDELNVVAGKIAISPSSSPETKHNCKVSIESNRMAYRAIEKWLKENGLRSDGSKL